MLEKLYADVLRNVRKDGFLGVTTADVAEVHNRMGMGLSPNGLVAWSIAQYLREHVNAEHTEGRSSPRLAAT